MGAGAAGPHGVLVQEEGNQEVEAVIIPVPVAVEGPASEKQLKTAHVRMRICNIFGRWK